MTDKEIQDLGTKQAKFRMLQSDHKYDYKSCYDCYNEGMHQALSKFGVSKRIHHKQMMIATACGIFLGLLFSFLYVC